MKIGIESGPFSYIGTPARQYAYIRGLGYDTVDQDLSDVRQPCYGSREAMARHCEDFREASEKTGLKIHQIHGPWTTDDTTEESRAVVLEQMKLGLYGAKCMGAGYMVIHPQMPYAWGREEDPELAAELTFRLLTNLIPTCEELDVTVCLENMPFWWLRLAPMERIVEVVRKVNSPYVQICLDTGHVNVLKGDLIADTRLCAPWLKTVHVHDNSSRVQEDFHLMPYLGSLDWDAFARALAQTEYSGPLSLETGGPSQNFPLPLRRKVEELNALTARYLADLIESYRK